MVGGPSISLSMCPTLTFSLDGGLKVEPFYKVVIIPQRDILRDPNRSYKTPYDITFDVHSITS